MISPLTTTVCIRAGCQQRVQTCGGLEGEAGREGRAGMRKCLAEVPRLQSQSEDQELVPVDD